MSDQKWEYLVQESLMRDSMVYNLNEVGRRGWELAGVLHNVLIFKRPAKDR